jgi:hypothetical protein
MRRWTSGALPIAQAVRTASLAGCHWESRGLAGAAVTRTRGVVTSVLVNLAILTMRQSLPVYPWKQTFSEPVGVSRRCQELPFAH